MVDCANGGVARLIERTDATWGGTNERDPAAAQNQRAGSLPELGRQGSNLQPAG
jgi:hypothetical protein